MQASKQTYLLYFAEDFIVFHNLFLLLYIEIPHWLSVYSRASADLDHKLRWEMFRLPELDCFNAMLTRLYKQELEEIVMRYEAYR